MITQIHSQLISLVSLNHSNQVNNCAEMSFKLFCFLVIFGVATAAPTLENRIINGTDADIESYPYVVSLRNYGGHTCGGSLISEEWVLTAAHCVETGPGFGVTIQYGKTIISREGETIIAAQKIIQHASYSPWYNYIHDIALIKLKAPVSLSSKAQLVKLPKKFYEVPATSTDATLVGWGLIANGTLPTRLQKVNYFIIDDEDCNKIYSGGTYKTNICAAYPGGGKGQCSGDSGGPLTSNGVQVGIVSWSIKPCALDPYPGVFTKVSHYIDWIEKQTGLTFN